MWTWVAEDTLVILLLKRSIICHSSTAHHQWLRIVWLVVRLVYQLVLGLYLDLAGCDSWATSRLVVIRHNWFSMLSCLTYWGGILWDQAQCQIEVILLKTPLSNPNLQLLLLSFLHALLCSVVSSMNSLPVCTCSTYCLLYMHLWLAFDYSLAV
jgi:hypothetical protein